jgi:integrase
MVPLKVFAVYITRDTGMEKGMETKGTKSTNSMVKSKRFQGVFVRQLEDGDRSFYIKYRDKTGKQIKEKVGKKSEGYTEEKASKIRGFRIQNERHPDEFPDKKQGEQQQDSLTFDDAFQRWIAYQTGRRIKNVKDCRYKYVKNLKAVLGPMALESITPTFVVTKINPIYNKYQGNGSIYLAHHIIRATFDHCMEHDLFRGPNPMDKVKTPRVQNKRDRFLSETEAKQLLDALKLVDLEVYHQAAISLLTGMRRDEIMKLRAAYCDFSSKLIFITGKGDKPRSVEMPDALEPILRAAIDNDPDRPLWGSKHFKGHVFRKVVGDLGFNWGVDPRDFRNKVTFHTLRHTYGSWQAQRGTPIMVIKELMGHNDIQTTMRYAKLGPRPGRDAVRGFGDDLVHRTVTS